MEERRSEDRRHLYYYSRVFDESTQAMAGRLVDISTAGMMLVSEKPINNKTHFSFRLILPKAIEGKKELHLEAQGRWSKRAVNPDLYDNGFELLNVTPKTAETIERLIQSTAFKY